MKWFGVVRRVPELLGIAVVMVMMVSGTRSEVKARAREVKVVKVVRRKPLLECDARFARDVVWVREASVPGPVETE